MPNASNSRESRENTLFSVFTNAIRTTCFWRFSRMDHSSKIEASTNNTKVTVPLLLVGVQRKMALVTAHKRSFRQGNIFTGVCHREFL